MYKDRLFYDVWYKMNEKIIVSEAILPFGNLSLISLGQSGRTIKKIVDDITLTCTWNVIEKNLRVDLRV